MLFYINCLVLHNKMEDNIKNSGKESEKQNKYVKYIVFGMVIILLIIIGVAFKPKETKFEYLGMEFEKVMFDKLLLYQTAVQPIDRITGKATDKNYIIYFRNIFNYCFLIIHYE